MSKNSKNTLQELFQRKQLPLPIYNSERVGGTDHSPLWKSTVILYDGQKFQGNLSSNKSNADISAADIALSHVKSNGQQTRLPQIISNHPSNNFTPIVPSILSEINLSNIGPPILPNVNFTIDSSIKVEKDVANQLVSPLLSDLINGVNQISMSEGASTAILVDVENLPKFIDAISNKLHNYAVYAFIGEHHCLSEKEYPPGIIKITSPSTRSDGTDTCMQVYTGMLLAREIYDSYIIATRDHYGSSLVEMISSPGLGWTPKKARLVTNPSQL